MHRLAVDGNRSPKHTRSLIIFMKREIGAQHAHSAAIIMPSHAGRTWHSSTGKSLPSAVAAKWSARKINKGGHDLAHNSNHDLNQMI